MPVNECRKTLINHQNVNVLPSKWSHRIFKKLPIITEITLTLMTSKAKSDMTHCGYLYPVRSVGLSFSCWSTTRGFPGRDPHNSSWTKCVLLCPQNLNNLRRTLKNLLIPDPERSPFVHSRYVCLYRIRVICTSFIKSLCQSLIKKTFVPGQKFIRTGSEIHINAGSKIIRLS